MLQINHLLEEYKNKDNRQVYQKSERAEIVKKFVDKLNADRVRDGRKPLPASFYAIKMAQSGLKSNFDLYWFYGYCNDARNFSSTWWWALNPKNTKK